MGRLTLDDRAGVDARVAWLDRYRELPKRSAAAAALTAEACAALRLSDSTWYELVERYEQGGRDAVCRRQRKDKGKSKTPQVVTLFLGYAKDPDHAHWNFTQKLEGFRAAMAQAGTPLRLAESTLRRQLKAVDPGYFKTQRENSERYTRYLHMDAEVANAVWQADQKQADFEVYEDETDTDTGELTRTYYRPLLFSFVDVASGAIMGSVWYKGNHQAYGAAIVEATLIRAIYPDLATKLPFCGVPELIYWDNGKAHTCQFTRDLAATLGIKLENSKPRRSEAHGFIEGWHRWVKDCFDAKLPHFHGSLSELKEKPLQLRLALDDHVPEPEALTLDQVNALWCEKQVELAYRPHETWSDKQAAALSGQPQELKCSFERWVSTITEDRRRVPDYGALCWAKMLRPRDDEPRIVRGGCVSFGGIDYTAPNLANLDGVAVNIRYLRDLVDKLWIVLKGDLYCVATPERPTGYGDWGEKHRRDQEKARGLKSFKQSADLLLREAEQAGVLDPAEALARKQRALEAVRKPTKKAVLAAAQARTAERAARPGEAEVIDLGSRRAREAAPLSPTERVLKAPELGAVADTSELWGTAHEAPRADRVTADELL